MPESAASLASLPFELKQEILQCLIHPQDILRFGLTCKLNKEVTRSSWRKAYLKRFGPIPDDIATSNPDSTTSASLSTNFERMLAAYKSLHQRSTFCDSRQFRIVWRNDTRYWEQVVEEHETFIHDYVHLRRVWWFDISCDFNGVLPGRYVPCFHIRSNNFHNERSRNNVQITFSSKQAGSEWVRIYTIPYSSVQKDIQRESEWTVVKFPALVVNWYADLNFTMWDHESSLKQGLSIDYLSLVPIESIERMEAIKVGLRKNENESLISQGAGILQSVASFFTG